MLSLHDFAPKKKSREGRIVNKTVNQGDAKVLFRQTLGGLAASWLGGEVGEKASAHG
jgi:hypothetical protein